MNSDVLIAGCGYVGTALGCRLARGGVRVWGLRRDPSDLPNDIQPLAGDVCDRRALETSFRELREAPLDVVYAVSPGGRDEGAYTDAYVRGPEHLLAALDWRRIAVRRLVFISSTAVYEQQDGSWVDECAPAEPAHFTGRRLLEGERLIRHAPFPAVTLRLSGIYGPGRTGLLERVRRGEAECPASPRFTNRIHRDDCAGAIGHLLALDAPEPLYVASDHEPADLCEVMRWLAARLDVPPPERAADGSSASGRRHRSHKRCRNTRLVRSGYHFLYPTFREGYASLVGEHRA